MENTNKITLLEIKRRHTEIWKKENELKALIKQTNKMLEDKRIEIDSMNTERTSFSSCACRNGAQASMHMIGKGDCGIVWCAQCSDDVLDFQ